MNAALSIKVLDCDHAVVIGGEVLFVVRRRARRVVGGESARRRGFNAVVIISIVGIVVGINGFACRVRCGFVAFVLISALVFGLLYRLQQRRRRSRRVVGLRRQRRGRMCPIRLHNTTDINMLGIKDSRITGEYAKNRAH